MDELLLGLAVLLSFLFGWNNGSLVVGNLRGSGVLSLRNAAVLCLFGLGAGVLLEGAKMSSSLAGSLTSTTTGSILTVTLALSIAITLTSTLLRLPISFSMVMVGAFLGGSVASRIGIQIPHSLDVITFWFVAPFLTAVLTYIVYILTSRLVARHGLLTVDFFNRSGATFSTLAVAYTLGANNVGLIYGGVSYGISPASQGTLTVVVLALAAGAGMVVSGKSGVSGTIGDRMLALSPQGVFTAFVASSVVVWAGTQLAIPISISQCLLGGMIGAAFTKNIAVLNRRLVAETVAIWVIAPLLAFVAAFALLVL